MSLVLCVLLAELHCELPADPIPVVAMDGTVVGCTLRKVCDEGMFNVAFWLHTAMITFVPLFPGGNGSPFAGREENNF